MTPDLSTHMEDLAWHYPAEPVERATLRYCEAVAKWRGKPELESVCALFLPSNVSRLLSASFSTFDSTRRNRVFRRRQAQLSQSSPSCTPTRPVQRPRQDLSSLRRLSGITCFSSPNCADRRLTSILRSRLRGVETSAGVPWTREEEDLSGYMFNCM